MGVRRKKMSEVGFAQGMHLRKVDVFVHVSLWNISDMRYHIQR